MDRIYKVLHDHEETYLEQCEEQRVLREREEDDEQRALERQTLAEDARLAAEEEAKIAVEMDT